MIVTHSIVATPVSTTMDKARHWVTRNSGWLSAVEGAASSITWLLPDRFSDSELSLEAVNSALGLISVIHSSMLLDPNPSRDTAGQQLSWALVALQQVEALIELGAMHVHKTTPSRKYDALLTLEAVKSALRLAMLHRRGGRVLLDGGTCQPGTSHAPGTSAQYNARVVEVHEAFARFRAKHGLPQQCVAPVVARASARTSGVGDHCLVAGEVLHVLRPLVYVAMLRRYGARSWTPWMTSLAVEVSSIVLTSAGGRLQHSAAAKQAKSPLPVWSEAEQRELLRRKLLLMYYLIRSPMYEAAVRQAVHRVQGVCSYVPLLRSVVDKAVEILEGVQAYYTYTAAS